MVPRFFHHCIIDGKKNRLGLQRIWNQVDCLCGCDIISSVMVIVVRFQCVVKSIQRSTGQSGDYMAVCKADRTKSIQSQNSDNEKKQVPCSRFCSIREIITKI